MKFGLYIKDKLGIIAGYAGFVIFTYLLMMAFHSQLQMRIMFVIAHTGNLILRTFTCA